MTVQEYKNLFAKIAEKVVNHNPALTKGQFFMVDDEEFSKAAKNFLNLNRMCIDVSYPIDTLSETNGSHIQTTVFVMNISKSIPRDNFDLQVVTLQEAKEVGEKFARYLYFIQRKNSGFGLKAGSQTKFLHSKWELKPLLNDETDNTCGRQMTLMFETNFNYCDAEIEADVKNTDW